MVIGMTCHPRKETKKVSNIQNIKLARPRYETGRARLSARGESSGNTKIMERHGTPLSKKF